MANEQNAEIDKIISSITKITLSTKWGLEKIHHGSIWNVKDIEEIKTLLNVLGINTATTHPWDLKNIAKKIEKATGLNVQFNQSEMKEDK